MSVFLTPDLKPFMGGTYFPPRDSYGRPGFSMILKSTAEQWKKDRDRIIQQARRSLTPLLRLSWYLVRERKGREVDYLGLAVSSEDMRCWRRGLTASMEDMVMHQSSLSQVSSSDVK